MPNRRLIHNGRKVNGRDMGEFAMKGKKGNKKESKNGGVGVNSWKEIGRKKNRQKWGRDFTLNGRKRKAKRGWDEFTMNVRQERKTRVNSQ